MANDILKSGLLFAGGLIAGAAIALLAAPQTGEETRNQLVDLASEAKKRAQDYCEQVKQGLQDLQSQEAEAAPQPETAEA